MKRKLTAAGLIAAFVLTIAIIGCGRAKEAADTARETAKKAKAVKELQEKGETTIETDEGTVTVKQKDGETTEVTTESKDGEKTVASSGGDADLSDLEIPVYPGAEQNASKLESSSEENHIAAEFTTSDSFEEVTDFYENEYPDAEKSTMSRADKQLFLIERETDGMEQMIGVEKDADKDTTMIVLEQRNQ